MANKKKEHSSEEAWSEEAIDTLINCFQSHEYIQNVTSGDYKDQNRKSLPLEEFDMSVQDINMTSIDMTIKNGIISEANSYCSKAATKGVL